MAEGLLTLNNGDLAVIGDGTLFLSENLTPGDFLYIEINSVPYTLPVDSVETEGKLTLLRKYSGPTINGVPWVYIPRKSQNFIYAALADQIAESKRLSLNNEYNWQQLLTVDGIVTIRRPDGTTYDGMSWPYIEKLAKDSDFELIKPLADQIRQDAKQVAIDKTTSSENAKEAVSSAQAAKSSETASSENAKEAASSAQAAKSSDAASSENAKSAASSATESKQARDQAVNAASNAAEESATSAAGKVVEQLTSAVANDTRRAEEARAGAESASTLSKQYRDEAKEIVDNITFSDASTNQKGLVKLNSATDSDSESEAATPKAVKAANDNANERVPSTRKINGKSLSEDMDILPSDIFNGAVVIGPNQNLNDYQTPGLYVQNANVNTSAALNYPENNAGSLSVLKSAGVSQVYHVYNSSRIWTRSKYSSSEWTAWAREYNTLNKPTAADVGALASGGNAVSATKLQTARTIGGVNFDGTANINLPGVNVQGSQNTTGNAATATKLQTARTINGVAFDGTQNITVGVSSAGELNAVGSFALAHLTVNSNTLSVPGTSYAGSSLKTCGLVVDSERRASFVIQGLSGKDTYGPYTLPGTWRACTIISSSGLVSSWTLFAGLFQRIA